MDELVHEHVLVRRQGKGTFVALHNETAFSSSSSMSSRAMSFRVADDLREREYPQVECVGFTRSRADEAEAATLRIKPGDPVCASPIACRWRAAGGARPAGGRGPDVQGPERETLPGAAEHDLQPLPDRPRHHRASSAGVGARRSADRETARILGVAVGLPVMEVHRIALTFGDKPVEYRISTINTASHDYVSLLAKR